MIFLEEFQSIFEFHNVEAMIRVKVVDFKGLRYSFLLLEDFLNLCSTIIQLILLFSHLLIKVIINHKRITTF